MRTMNIPTPTFEEMPPACAADTYHSSFPPSPPSYLSSFGGSGEGSSSSSPDDHLIITNAKRVSSTSTQAGASAAASASRESPASDFIPSSSLTPALRSQNILIASSPPQRGGGMTMMNNNIHGGFVGSYHDGGGGSGGLFESDFHVSAGGTPHHLAHSSPQHHHNNYHPSSFSLSSRHLTYRHLTARDTGRSSTGVVQPQPQSQPNYYGDPQRQQHDGRHYQMNGSGDGGVSFSPQPPPPPTTNNTNNNNPMIHFNDDIEFDDRIIVPPSSSRSFFSDASDTSCHHQAAQQQYYFGKLAALYAHALLYSSSSSSLSSSHAPSGLSSRPQQQQSSPSPNPNRRRPPCVAMDLLNVLLTTFVKPENKNTFSAFPSQNSQKREDGLQHNSRSEGGGGYSSARATNTTSDEASSASHNKPPQKVYFGGCEVQGVELCPNEGFAVLTLRSPDPENDTPPDAEDFFGDGGSGGTGAAAYNRQGGAGGGGMSSSSPYSPGRGRKYYTSHVRLFPVLGTPRQHSESSNSGIRFSFAPLPYEDVRDTDVVVAFCFDVSNASSSESSGPLPPSFEHPHRMSFIQKFCRVRFFMGAMCSFRAPAGPLPDSYPPGFRLCATDIPSRVHYVSSHPQALDAVHARLTPTPAMPTPPSFFSIGIHEPSYSSSSIDQQGRQGAGGSSFRCYLSEHVRPASAAAAEGSMSTLAYRPNTASRLRLQRHYEQQQHWPLAKAKTNKFSQQRTCVSSLSSTTGRSTRSSRLSAAAVVERRTNRNQYQAASSRSFAAKQTKVSSRAERDYDANSCDNTDGANINGEAASASDDEGEVAALSSVDPPSPCSTLRSSQNRVAAASSSVGFTAPPSAPSVAAYVSLHSSHPSKSNKTHQRQQQQQQYHAAPRRRNGGTAAGSSPVHRATPPFGTTLLQPLSDQHVYQLQAPYNGFDLDVPTMRSMLHPLSSAEIAARLTTAVHIAHRRHTYLETKDGGRYRRR